MSKPKPLLIHEDPPTMAVWQTTLKKTLDRGTHEASNLARARELLAESPEDWSLVVLPDTARRDAYTRGGSDCDAVVEFVSELHQTYPDLPVIVIAQKRHPALHVLAGVIKRMALIEAQADWLDLLAEKAWALISAPADIQPELDVEIRVMDDRHFTWSLKLHGRITADTFSNQDLYIDPAKFQAVRAMQSPPEEDHKFKDWSDALARNLHEMLFQGAADQLTFHDHFVDTTARVDPERTRVRICSESDTHHDMHFDLLKRLLNDPKPMMLQSPIVRQHGSRRSLQSLFFPPTKLRCLVVLARGVDVTVRDPDGVVVFPGLPAAALEAREVFAALAKSAAYPGSLIAMEKDAVTGVEAPAVRLLTLKNGDDVVFELSEALKQGPWHLVHFVGHGRTVPNPDGTGPEQRGELVLCSQDRTTIDFKVLAERLRDTDTRMMFLSACQTGQGAFLSSAAYHMVPAIIGYRWRVKDARARDFAKVFYDAMLMPGQPTRHSVERAFVAARAGVHASIPADCSWASPALLHQIDG